LRKKPDFTLGQYKDLEVPKPAEEKPASHLYEEIMQDIRIRFAEAVPFAEDEFIQMGDNVILNYRVFDGEKHLSEFDSEGEMAAIGKSRIPGFDQSVLGMKVGDTREFSLQIPTEGVIPDLAGKILKFAVTLVLGSRAIPMPLNDELAQKIGKGSFEEMQTYVMGLATAKIAEMERAKLLNQISAKLLDMNDITVPDWLKVSEAQYIAAQANVEWDKVADDVKEKYIENADRNVKLSLILDRVREDEPTAQLSDQEVIEMIKQTLSKGSENIDDSLKQMNQNGYLAVLVARVRDENTLDFILKNSKILE
jgi:trigger factor